LSRLILLMVYYENGHSMIFKYDNKALFY